MLSTIKVRIVALTMIAAAIIAVIGGTMFGAGEASAKTITITSGAMINDASLKLFGINVPAGLCMTLAGQDANTGKNVAVTVGHCFAENGQVNTNWFTPIGTGYRAEFNIKQPQETNKLDVGAIWLNENVDVAPSGRYVVSPEQARNNDVIVRGYGLWTPHVATSRITHVYDTDFRVSMVASPGASGGIIETPDGGIVGLMSRGFKDYMKPDAAAMRFDFVLNYIASQWGIRFINY
jgi:hypothetical protein